MSESEIRVEEKIANPLQLDLEGVTNPDILLLVWDLARKSGYDLVKRRVVVEGETLSTTLGVRPKPRSSVSSP